MVYEITGKVDEVCGVQTFKSGFQKRDIIVNVQDANSKYPNFVKFTAAKELCAALDSIRQGDGVKVRFVVSGHVWDSPKGRQVFNDLKIIKIEAEVASQKSCAPAPAEHADNASDGYPDDGDMPF